MKLYFILILAPFLLCNAQNKLKMTVQYKLYCAPRDGAEQTKFLSFGIPNEAVVQDFNLYINDSISYYTDNVGIDSDDLNKEFCILGAFSDNPIYFSKNKDFLYKPTFLPGMLPEDAYLIVRNPIKNWNITSISKVIDGKLCYKAIAEDSYNHRYDKKVKFEVTAWFCPEIPLQYGPSLYNGLPGLILEVSFMRYAIIASKISYDLDEKAIKKPFGKKLIDEDSFSILRHKRLYEYKDELIKEMKKQSEKQ